MEAILQNPLGAFLVLLGGGLILLAIVAHFKGWGED